MTPTQASAAIVGTDSYNRQIQVWQAADGTFCATVDYQGQFVTNAGLSPSGAGLVTAGIRGNFNGGYLTTHFTGTLNPSPAYATRGNLGTFDYNFGATVWSWTDTYFTTTAGFDLAWWGARRGRVQQGARPAEGPRARACSTSSPASPPALELPRPHAWRRRLCR